MTFKQHATSVELFSILIGVCLLGVTAIWIFNPLGVKVPVAAMVGCLLGAAGGYGFARGLLRFQGRKAAQVGAEQPRGADRTTIAP